MTSGGEGPGIGGVPGLAKPSTRAPKAYQLFARQFVRNLPRELTGAHRSRIRLRRLGGR